MEYAHSVIVTLKKDKQFPIRISYNGNAKNYTKALWIGELPAAEQDAFRKEVVNWDEKTLGLFVDYNSVIGFVMIVENLFKGKYQIEYKWIGGADPYEEYMKSQDENPKGTVY